jgi:hypothetical protein
MTMNVDDALRHFDPRNQCDDEYYDDDWNPEDGEDDHKSEDSIW